MQRRESDKIWDCIVVGAGIEGSNAARFSASLGKNTLCLEQFPLPHDRGSSHGQSRITRYMHHEPHLAKMMPEAFKLWADIEQLANTKLFINCGFLRMEEHPYVTLKEILANFRANGIASELLNAEQLKKEYNFDFPVNVKGVFEKTGGVLLASKCLRVIQDQFVEFGGVLHDDEKVLEIMPGDIVKVKTNKGCYKTRKLILTPGPWAKSLLKSLGVDLPLRPNYLSVCYWKTKKEGFDMECGYPAWACKILNSSEGHKGNIYSTPCYEYPNMVKVCYGEGPDIDPDRRDDVDISWTVDTAAKFVEQHLIGVETRPSIVEHCIQTSTPDGTCILDKHPRFKNIIFGVGFSGYGFKLAPVYGKILCELAFHLGHTYDLQPFRVDRFVNQSPKSTL